VRVRLRHCALGWVGPVLKLTRHPPGCFFTSLAARASRESSAPRPPACSLLGITPRGGSSHPPQGGCTLQRHFCSRGCLRVFPLRLRWQRLLCHLCRRLHDLSPFQPLPHRRPCSSPSPSGPGGPWDRSSSGCQSGKQSLTFRMPARSTTSSK